MATTFVVTDIIDDFGDSSGGSWDNAPDGECPTLADALALAERYATEHAPEGDYGQNGIDPVTVHLLVDIEEIDEDGDTVETFREAITVTIDPV